MFTGSVSPNSFLAGCYLGKLSTLQIPMFDLRIFSSHLSHPYAIHLPIISML
jgi:hypothetical protein